jgi:hypothetical protein
MWRVESLLDNGRNQATVRKQQQMVFSVRSVPRSYKKDEMSDVVRVSQSELDWRVQSCAPSEDCYRATASEDRNRLRQHVL